MKKTKLTARICVFLVACMLFPVVFASCDSGERWDEAQNRKAVLLTIRFLVEDSTTQEAIDLVEKEINNITETKYTTRIKLIGLKRDEYEAEITRLYEAYDEEQERLKEEEEISKSIEKESKEQARKDKAAGITQAPTKKPTDPPRTTELYTEKIIWPDLKKDQLDIFLITSSEMFQELAADDRLEGLDEELGTKAKVLKEFIHPSIMMAGQYGDKTLAIPTNKLIGEATYIAVNKRLVEEFNVAAEASIAAAEAAEAAAAEKEDSEDEETADDEESEEGEEKEAIVKLSKLDLKKVTEYQNLTQYLEWVKANKSDVALINGPFEPIKNFDNLFPEMQDFAAVSNTSRPSVYVPEQEPTEPPTTKATEPPTDDDGNLVTEDPLETTIPPTTNKPKNTPAVTTLAPAKASMANKYTSAPFLTVAKLNQEYKEKGLFETSDVPAGKERAAYVATGTLEDKLAWEAADKANGFDYEYIMYSNPVADRYDLQNGMYAVSVSSKVTTMRCMEIITLMNTNKQFKNLFAYGIEKTHYIYNDNNRIERINTQYMVDPNYTGNQFIGDLMEGENPNKYEIAKEHNLNVVNSVFLNLYFDKSKLTPESEEAIPKVEALSRNFKRILLDGNIPSEYEDIDDYVSGYVTPEFEDAGWTELMADIKAQVSPPSD
ncbi:MAG: hypothetical protein FWG34_06635 [Oscillospiraceae bacterium]|nr:hypothetical protein [Oscillospiraceae bacterium]